MLHLHIQIGKRYCSITYLWLATLQLHGDSFFTLLQQKRICRRDTVNRTHKTFIQEINYLP
jgi:UDP-2,3-diacylglucosamine pyrophosphatase LpxH